MGQNYTLIFIAVFFLCLTGFSFLLNGLLLKFSKNLGIRDKNEVIIRWSATSKPSLGGISFFIGFLISIAGYAFFFSESSPLYKDTQLLGFIGAGGIAFLLGLSDDAYNTRPLFKFLTQILCSVILIFSGIYISVFDSNFLNYFLTGIWVVGMMNSINMLDNMDAITAVVSVFIILIAMVFFFIIGNFSKLYLIMLSGVLASITGFLFYNWHPSKIFMGDTGSQFLGVFLAAMGILFFWNGDTFPVKAGFWEKTKHITIVVISFIIPIVDTATVTINRIARGQSPFIGGRDHTTHSLSYLGFSDRQVALIYAGISLLSFVLVILIKNAFTRWNGLFFLAFICYFCIVFFILFLCTRIHKEKNYGKKLKEQNSDV